LATADNAINATVYPDLPFDFMRDTAPVAMVASVPNVMEVNPANPDRTVAAFIADAKANPGKINFASVGSGSPSRVTAELLKMMTGIDMVHVPYRGGAQVVTDLMGGRVQVFFGALSGSIDHIRSGRLRALAVTSAERSPALPDVPTVGEFVPGYAVSAFFGLAAPKNTPAEIVDTLNAAVNAGLADPKLKAQLESLGGAAMPMTPAAFGKLIADDTETWAKVVRFAGIQAD
jgi:tripartite-type tricarboxylate transporter receptor subunit TctC